MATMSEIAEKADVSMTTVSRVLSEDVTLKISDEKRQRVLDVAKELNYVSMRQKKKKKDRIRVGIVHWYTSESEFTYPYFLKIRIGIEKYCSMNQIEFIRLEHEDIPVYKKSLDAVIAVGLYEQEERDYISRLSKYTIFIDNTPKPIKHDSISFDYHQGIHDVVTYFRKLGHERIGYIGGSKYLRKVRPKTDTMKDQLGKELLHTTGIREEWMLEGENTAESGYLLMKQLFKGSVHPTAVFVESALMAVGTYRAINEQGQLIPEHISIIAISDFGGEAYMLPALSTLTGDIDALTESVIDRIKEVVHKPKWHPREILLPLTLEIRESCKMI